MENLDYVKLACSKDETRYNLTEVYRAPDRLVATDGHRMHWIEQPKIEKGFYIDGLDAEFPNYDQVMPKNSVVTTTTITASLWLEYVKQLKALCNLLKVNDRGMCVKLELDGVENFRISWKQLHTEGQISSGIFEPKAVLGINLSYLIDAIPPVRYGTNEICTYATGIEILAPITVKNMIGNALIIPMRLNAANS